MIRERKAEYVKREKDVLLRLGQHDHPFFVKLYATFQDPNRLCILLTRMNHCSINAVLYYSKLCCVYCLRSCCLFLRLFNSCHQATVYHG